MSEELAVFGEGSLTFQEFAMREPLPLATIHEAVLEFLRGRADAVLSGAHAVNAYVPEPRMTQDVDLFVMKDGEFTERLLGHLQDRFRILLQLRKKKNGSAFRIDQPHNPTPRHLVDVRSVAVLPSSHRLADVLVVTPPELIAGKVRAIQRRRRQAKEGTDWRDLIMLLFAFSELKTRFGPVRERLEASEADAAVFALWEEIVRREFLSSDEDSEFR